MMTAKYFNPYTDFGFKKLFGEEANKDLLIDFLNSLLPEVHSIQTLEFRNTEHLGLSVAERRAVFDIFCKAKSGERFVVEMQKAKQLYFKDRSLFYGSRLVVEQAIRGEWDFKLSAVYLIGILDFEYDESEDSRKFMRDVTLKDQDGDAFCDKLQFKFLQMPIFNKTESELKTQQDKWVYFLKNLENFDSIPAIFREPVFEKAFHTAELAAMCPTERDKYEADLQIYRDNMAVLTTAKVEGEIKGKVEDIVLLLEDKFGLVPTSLVAALNVTTDFAVLKSLLIKASRCSSLEEFEDAAR
ncbi:MAG: Rpn family recombination-promoting nuclease/putative transposase [Planctomycetaceae bacterium]|nr:Rpn family recombination-promoting nuclease/putative transposase [Planctomycetaceae bacterium]